MWVLIGEGANDVEIPCLIWADKETALSRCKEIFGEDPKEYHEDDGTVRYRWLIEESEGAQKALDEMYTGYYGGCGDCYAATLREAEEGKPFVRWDLD